MEVVGGVGDDDAAVVAVGGERGGDVAAAELVERVPAPTRVCWRRLMVSSTTRSPSVSSAARNAPPAATSGSWWWSPTSTTLAPTVAAWSTRAARSRVPAIAASSTTTTVVAVIVRCSTRWRAIVVDTIPEPSCSSRAARAEGASPIDVPAGVFVDGAQGAEGVGLAGPGPPDHHRDPIAGRGRARGSPWPGRRRASTPRSRRRRRPGRVDRSGPARRR